MSIVLPVRGDYIQLDQLLKATGLCSSGGIAHAEIEAGNVRVDGAVETRKRAKLHPGQRVAYADETVELVADTGS
jgi:ribosome-associated protein